MRFPPNFIPLLPGMYLSFLFLIEFAQIINHSLQYDPILKLLKRVLQLFFISSLLLSFDLSVSDGGNSFPDNSIEIVLDYFAQENFFHGCLGSVLDFSFYEIVVEEIVELSFYQVVLS